MLIPRVAKFAKSDATILKYDDYNLTESLGYLVGASAGDGWVRHSKGVVQGFNLAGVSEAVFARYKKAIKKILGEDQHIGFLRQEKTENRYAACNRLNICNVPFATLLESWIGHGADNKHLPVWAFTAPFECRKAIIEGLFDTDGSVALSHAKKKTQLHMSIQTNSLRMARELQHLFRTLNVYSRITPSTTPAGRPCWMLAAKVLDLINLKLNLSCENKKEAYESGVIPSEDSPSAAATDIVPITKELAKVAMKEVPYGKENGYNGLYCALQRASKTGYISRMSAEKLIADFGEKLIAHGDYKMFTLFVENKDISWDIVENVVKTDMVETGYDITVPPYETFMNVDGVILSNTMSYSVPVSREAVNEAVSKMMTDKNLISIKDDKPLFTAGQDYLMGLWLASRDASNKKAKRYMTKAEAVRDYKKGVIDLNDPIEIVGAGV